MPKSVRQSPSAGESRSQTLGVELKRRRQELGIDLKQISETTCIGLRFLKAIEGDDFKTLPGGLFTRSFIRTYARHVNMDEDLALTLYFRQTGQDEAEKYEFTSLALSSASGPSMWINIVVAVVVLIILVIGGFAGWHYLNQ